MFFALLNFPKVIGDVISRVYGRPSPPGRLLDSWVVEDT